MSFPSFSSTSSFNASVSPRNSAVLSGPKTRGPLDKLVEASTRREGSVQEDISLFVHSVREFCDDSEVGTTAAKTPEEIRVGMLGGLKDGSICQDDFGCDEVVGYHSMLTSEKPASTSQGDSSDSYTVTILLERSARSTYPCRWQHP